LSVLSYSLLCFSCCNNGKQLFVSLCVFVVF
jgi:hypothetical protein